MEYRSGHAEVQAEGFLETYEFGVAVSAKTFKATIDGIYSRKIEAAIRELATNAVDAHAAAGNPAPFHVNIPSAVSPVFSIRDFGTAMTHEVVTTRYNMLFDSTKDGLNPDDAGRVAANKQVGMLGLGRMSFFAYTDNCTLTVWLDGRVRHYVISMGSAGVPRLSYAGEYETAEPNGVKVEFAVKAKDTKAFQTAAARVFKGFDQQPIGLPASVAAQINVTPSESGSFWRAYPADYLPGSGFYARQGCVLYPIDLAEIDEVNLTDDEDGDTVVTLSENFKRFAALKMTVVIDFPIGTIDFDVSRERLAYTEDTVRALRARWDAFQAELDAVFEAAIDACKTPFERMLAVKSDLFTGLGPLFASSRYFSEASVLAERILSGLPANKYARHGKRRFSSALRLMSHATVDSPDHAVILHRDQFHKPSAASLANCIIVFRTEGRPRGMYQRVARHMAVRDIRWAFFLEPDELTLAAYREMGCPPIVRLKDIDPVPTHSRGGSGVAPPPFDRFKLIADDGETYQGATSEVDVEGHLFCFLNCGHVMDQPWKKRWKTQSVMDLHQILKGFTGQSISFINVRKNEDLNRWASYPLFYGALEALIDNLSLHQVDAIVRALNRRRFDKSKYSVILGCKPERLGKKTPITQLRRFEARYDALPEDLTRQCEKLLDLLDDDLLGIVIDRAVAAGFEVLPQMGYCRQTSQDFGHPKRLLPKKWERLGDVLTAPVRNDNLDFLFQTLRNSLANV